ncbi:YceI family protein [Epilithonimonas mollis]|uniref:YceI-like domain-containing protein n=1 Tax=Epilithonimonas mollis TaxID=216903 RepID=A0A1M6PDK7_9FLAO|nr:YceI family protein [Epilithonimonas mollis]SHK06048.1 YceI-like domain-containing protein [Epilithonimonas mollis]
MKILVFFISLILTSNFAFAQKYSTKTGKITFEASVPLFEDVYAENNNSTAILNADTGDIASLAMVNAFTFKSSLMQEHFNENYAESAKYPKTSFKGKIVNFDKNDLSAKPKAYMISGILNFHGVDKQVQSSANVYLKDDKIVVQGKLVAKTADFKVKIPKMVAAKVAENVNVNYNFILQK